MVVSETKKGQKLVGEYAREIDTGNRRQYQRSGEAKCEAM